MNSTFPPPKDWREGRRYRALELKQQGWKQCQIAQALGVSEGAVSQWLRRAKTQGVEGLRHVPPPGAPSRLNAQQQQELLDLLAQGAQAFGFKGDVWTGARVAKLIQSHFNVSYHKNYIPTLLKSLNWTPQKPVKKAKQRNQEAIDSWLSETWPEIKKKQK